MSASRLAQQAGNDAADELAAILEGSADSMRAAAAGADGAASVAPGAAPAQRSAWWRARLALDGRLRALLERLDAAWLGPWRYESPPRAMYCMAALMHVHVVLEGRLRMLLEGLDAAWLGPWHCGQSLMLTPCNLRSVHPV